jgi:general secretion pathway protein I
VIKRPRQCGFTLIEVMVALAISAIGLAAVLGVVTHSSRNAMHMREQILANWIAQNVITELRISGRFPSASTSSGRVTYAGTEWAYEQTVVESGVPGLRRINVAVRLATQPPQQTVANVTGFVGANQSIAPPSNSTWDVASAGGSTNPRNPPRLPTASGIRSSTSSLGESTVQPSTSTSDDDGTTTR